MRRRGQGRAATRRSTCAALVAMAIGFGTSQLPAAGTSFSSMRSVVAHHMESLSWTKTTLSGITYSKGATYSLGSAACPSRTSCFVVGNEYSASGKSVGIVEHFDGRTWIRLHVGLASDVWESVSCATAHFCMIVGSDVGYHALAEIDDAGHWIRAHLPRSSSQLSAVSCPEPGMCLATGDRTGGFGVFVSWEYYSDTWHTVTVHSGIAADVSVSSISCVNAADCEGVGSYGYGGSGGSGISFHFNGVSWTSNEIQSSGEYRGGFGNVSCTHAGLCVATEDLSWPLPNDADGLSGFLAQELVHGRWKTLGRGLPPPDQLVVDEGGVQCFTQGWCIVIGGSAHPMYLGVVANHHLSNLHVVHNVRLRGTYPWLASLSCAGPTFCVEVSENLGSPYVLLGKA